MLKIRFHPDVVSEIRSSYNWYQAQANGLGEDFLCELESTYKAILELPDTWPLFQKDFKRYLLAQFPFSVIYRRNKNVIYVVAVMHNSRKPYYWDNRT